MTPILKAVVWVIGFLYYVSLYQVWNILFNTWWLLVILLSGNWKKTRVKMAETEKELISFAKFRVIYSRFEYIFDGVTKTGLLSKWPTWMALPIVIFYRGIKGNCEEGATFAQWLWKAYLRMNPKMVGQFTMKTRIMVPFNKPLSVFTKVHFIAVLHLTGDVVHVFSSGKVYDLTADEFATTYLNTTKYVWLK